jgi:hypothetical protein
VKLARRFAIVLLVLSVAQLACAGLAATEAAPLATATAAVEPSAAASAAATVEPSALPSTEPSAEPSLATATRTATATFTPFPLSPSPARLQLEMLQYQAWTDYQGNARVNVLFRNPYDFPVGLDSSGHAALRNAAGKFMRQANLYFQDGISGGTGFLLPGETVAAIGCFTCEENLLTEAWASVIFQTSIQDATGQWNTSTEVEANIPSVSFDGNSPIFFINGTVKNNSAATLSRISARVIVYDQDGKLVGVGEAFAENVAAGASASARGNGIGQAPPGPIHYDVTALGVTY